MKKYLKRDEGEQKNKFYFKLYEFQCYFSSTNSKVKALWVTKC